MPTNDHLSRRSVLGGIAATIGAPTFLADEAAGSSPCGGVYTTNDVDVREGPGLNYDVITTVPEFTGGYEIDGPVANDGYIWWKCRFCTSGGVTGWVPDSYLAGADFVYPATGTIVSDWYTPVGSGYHEAIDIANDYGTPVFAARGGTAFTGYDSSWGYYVLLDHGSGCQTTYRHLDSVFVSDGQSVTGCHHIGDMGTTGSANSPHVHFAIDYYGTAEEIPGNKYQEVLAGCGIPRAYRV